MKNFGNFTFENFLALGALFLLKSNFPAPAKLE